MWTKTKTSYILKCREYKLFYSEYNMTLHKNAFNSYSLHFFISLQFFSTFICYARVFSIV